MRHQKVQKVVSVAALGRLLRRRQAQGQRIVFTNGVFDLLHAGHLVLLQKARSLGDCLVVGMNSDASARRLKGLHRPLIAQRDRAALLSALACVDYVTIFDENTPSQLVRRLKPDVLVKGGDYALDQIVGRGLVKRVVRVPLVRGRSTTALVQKILRAYG
jgi:D-beta-D-heptose 7-phosphate kinase/D-beta-D-heptose 1-phosphate adenosyltransferase